MFVCCGREGDPMTNWLYYGDNLDVLRKKVASDSVDLCYIDPPFNSKRNYNQIYNNIGTEDRAQAQAFVDMWVWDDRAREGFEEILGNGEGRFTAQTVDLFRGLHSVLKPGSLLAYLVSMTLRITEIHRVLKPTGSFYLHCDPTSSHYLKLILDAVFCSQGGDFLNEIVWCYRGGGSPRRDFGRRHDIIFRYSKSDSYVFNADPVRVAYQAEGIGRKDDAMWGRHRGTDKVYKPHPLGKIPEDWWPMNVLNANDPERLGYPTQKPEKLLARIIEASSNPGDLVLDAYCGCGTTIAVAQRLNRRWIGIDITYQSIAVILKRLEEYYGSAALANVKLDGIPRDMASARALAAKRDDRVRKEFEKWAVLTYTKNRAKVNDKKGADGGIDGVAYTMTGSTTNAKIVLQVKSGHVSRADVATLRGDMTREGAPLAVLITLEPPTEPMRAEAKAVPAYHHPLMGRNYDAIQVVTVQDIIEQGATLDIPLGIEVLKTAERKTQSQSVQLELPDGDASQADVEADGDEDYEPDDEV